MKYNCKECNFQWEGTVNTFDKVREHEKEHLEKNELTPKVSKIITIRCKVCNTSNVTVDQTKSNCTLECKTCGNVLDLQGNVINHK